MNYKFENARRYNIANNMACQNETIINVNYQVYILIKFGFFIVYLTMDLNNY